MHMCAMCVLCGYDCLLCVLHSIDDMNNSHVCMQTSLMKGRCWDES